MNPLLTPPPPPFFPQTTTQTPPNDVVPHHPPHSSSSPTSSVTTLLIIISSIIIISAILYLLIRRLTKSRSTTISPTNDHVIIPIYNTITNTLPIFTFSSLTGKITDSECSVCLSRFEGKDQLRLLPLCCHAFHARCIDAWIKTNDTCPLCRSTVHPTEADIANIANKLVQENTSGSFSIDIGTISERSEPAGSDGELEVPVETTTVDNKDGVTNEVVDGGSGRVNWLRDYVDRLSSRTMSFRGGSGRFFTGSSRRSDIIVEDFEVSHGRVGEEISELFRWISGV